MDLIQKSKLNPLENGAEITDHEHKELLDGTALKHRRFLGTGADLELNDLRILSRNCCNWIVDPE